MTTFQRLPNFCARSWAGCGPVWALYWVPDWALQPNAVHDPVIVPYESIPHFPKSTVEGHSGRLVAGTLGGTPVVVMQGRVHFYEGYSPNDVTFPMRVMGALGMRAVILTNAAGGIAEGYKIGQLVLIADHINMMGWNPLVGPNEPRFAFDRPNGGLALL